MIHIPRFLHAGLCAIPAVGLILMSVVDASGYGTCSEVSRNEAHSEKSGRKSQSGYSPENTLPDTLLLEEIRILGTRIEVPDHQQPVWIQNIDSDFLRQMPHESAAYLLAGHSFSMIRDYGDGNMALVSQRGFSPGHSRILLEEMPLNHPMLGVFDLSLVPAGLLDGISSSSGNPAAMSGSGGIGGTISLRTRMQQDRAFFSQSIGSYGFEQTGAGASYTEGAFSGGIRAYLQRGDYDFPYDDPDPVRQEKRTRDNNHKSAGYLLAQGSYSHRDWRFRSLVWLDNIANELPGSIHARTPARQDDRSQRWLFQSGYDGFERTWITATAGWYRYELDYTDWRTNRTGASTTRLYMFKPVVRHVWSAAHESNLASQWTYQTVDTDHYAGWIHHHQVSTRMNHSWQITSLITLYPSVEWEMHSKFDSALNPALGLTLNPGIQSLTIRGMISRNRNIPTFNDMYWQPGGNADLQPETVASYETGITYRYAGGDEEDMIVAGVTIFWHDFENGIRWIPGPDGRFAAHNIERIRSDGVELDLEFSHDFSVIRADVHYLVSHTRASIHRERYRGDDSVGRQMIYVPEWMHKGSLQAAYRKRIWTRIAVQQIGQRFTTMDHSSPRDPLRAFARFDLDAGFSASVRSMHLRASLGIRNLTDQTYEVIAGYPVAPRHYRASLTISLK